MLEAHEKARQFTVVGQRVTRVDGEEKVTGQAEYVADIVLPGLLWGAVLRSPYPHARIRHIDTSRARALRGVRAVVTAADTPRRSWGVFAKDQPVLAIDKVHYLGKEVAAVAAGDLDTAREALDLIEVERKRKRHVSHHRYVAIIVDETVAALADFPAETSFAK